MAYRASLILAHPPLMILVLYFWRTLGHSELMLRMPSVIAGTLFCWVFFKWLAEIFDRQVALVGLIFAALLPPLVCLSAEIRQYSLLLLFMACAAYMLERALAEPSARLMLLFSAFLYLAMLSNYSSLMFVAAIGIYSLLRMISGRFPRNVVWIWGISQAGALALFVFLYRSHISKLNGSSLIEQATGGWLRRSYFHPGQQNLLVFIVGRTLGVFRFIFGSLIMGHITGLFFIIGLILLFRSEPTATPNRVKPWQIGFFFLVPFALNCVAGIFGAYPYGSTRHSVFLAFWGLAGISFFVVRVFKERLFIANLAVIAIVAICALVGNTQKPHMDRKDQALNEMEKTLAFIQQISPSVPILADVQTRFLLGYYLCPEQKMLEQFPQGNFDILQCGAHKLITLNTWTFSPETFMNSYGGLVKSANLQSSDQAWVAQAGWEIELPATLKASLPAFQNLQTNSFGKNIQFFKIVVSQPNRTPRS